LSQKFPAGTANVTNQSPKARGRVHHTECKGGCLTTIFAEGLKGSKELRKPCPVGGPCVRVLRGFCLQHLDELNGKGKGGPCQQHPSAELPAHQKDEGHCVNRSDQHLIDPDGPRPPQDRCDRANPYTSIKPDIAKVVGKEDEGDQDADGREIKSTCELN